MRFAVLVFPGSNCDHDVYHVLKHVLGQDAVFAWHKDRDLHDADAVIVPGGFSYGDYLRCGALARHSPVMEEVVAFAKRGGPVLGICNGFQILTEAGLLPGALTRNAGLRFVCRDQALTIEGKPTRFTSKLAAGTRLNLPIAHAEGCWIADEDTANRVEGEGRVVLRYAGENPNGSLRDVAGVSNERGNVVGMMPHPERAAETILGSDAGRAIFESVLG